MTLDLDTLLTEMYSMVDGQGSSSSTSPSGVWPRAGMSWRSTRGPPPSWRPSSFRRSASGYPSPSRRSKWTATVSSQPPSKLPASSSASESLSSPSLPQAQRLRRAGAAHPHRGILRRHRLLPGHPSLDSRAARLGADLQHRESAAVHRSLATPTEAGRVDEYTKWTPAAALDYNERVTLSL